MNQLGGLWRKMPVTFGCMLVAAAGISGIPLFNGFVSKCMIHHGLVAAGEQGGGMLLAAEWIFLLTCAGTFACFVKFIGLVFLQKPGTKWDDSVRDPPPAMLAAMIAMVLPIIVIGVRPQWLLEGLIAPGLSVLTIPVDPVGHFLSHYLFSAADFRSFAGMTITAIALSVAGMRYGLFDLHAPDRLGVDYWYRAGGRGFLRLCHGLGEFSSRLRIGIQRRSAQALKGLISLLEHHEKPAATSRDRDFKRLDALRDRVGAKAEELARSQPDDLSRHDREQLVNDVHWISGLLCTNMVEQAMASFTGSDNRRSIRQWVSAAEDQGEALARSALQLAVAWRDESGITDDELQASLRKTLPPLPASRDPEAEQRQRRWREELHELVFRPAHHHWPVTESLDRGRLAARIRSHLNGTARNLTLALGLAFALLALFLILLVP